MKIYTSYYGNLKKLKESNIIPISIARWQPKWYAGITYKVVAPTADMLKSDNIKDDYVAQYKRILSALNAKKVVDQILFLTGGRDCALLCYEKPNDFCHRHLLAEWLQSELGIIVREFGIENIEIKEKPEQLSLF